MSQDYSSSNMQVLEGLEAVRLRPGMYVGGRSKKALHHLFTEILDNSVDESIAGFASLITITLEDDNWVSVEDDGRGIPVDIHPKTGLSGVETVLTTLHAGGKFDKKSYKISGGLHGVGAKAVNALSEKFQVTVFRENKIHYIEFEKGGNPIDRLKVIGTYEGQRTGTLIKFKPDYTVMEHNSFELNIIADRAKQIAYLNPKLTIHIIDKRVDKELTYHFKGGLLDYIKERNSRLKPLYENVISAEGSHPLKDSLDILVEVALQHTNSFSSNIISYVNNIATEDGTHVQGFYDALLRTINNYAMEMKFIKKEEEKFTRDDIKEGVTAIIAIKHPNPDFEGQTKEKLSGLDSRRAVREIFSEKFERFLNENPDKATLILERASSAKKARIAATSARDAERKKTIFDSSSLPGKLADCSSKNPEKKELYIVEGNSAGGSAKMGRNREIQAILPLRGKVINTGKSAIEKVFNNEEIRSLIAAFGTGVNETFNINKLRYHKIIIMTDADIDGAHIRTLLLTFFYHYYKPLIEYGFVYIAQPPLFKITHGRIVKYVYNEADKVKYLESLGPDAKVSMQRYKGLGEMNPEQLWETTMDPEIRTMYQVQIKDAERAEQIFQILMGDDVKPRRAFIEENAQFTVEHGDLSFE